jgi:hypothetical protein
VIPFGIGANSSKTKTKTENIVNILNHKEKYKITSVLLCVS